jgi:hypothetical protein
MGRSAKVTAVIAGYVLAVTAGFVAGWIYDVRVSSLPYDTSGGMYAGGQMLTSLAAFLVVALVPTLLGLWLLRRHTGFWNGVAIISLAFAVAGLMAVLMPLIARDPKGNPALMLVDLLGLSQLLGAPLWLMAFALFAFIAPTRLARRRLALAVAIEVVIGGCALIHWFVPRPPL